MKLRDFLDDLVDSREVVGVLELPYNTLFECEGHFGFRLSDGFLIFLEGPTDQIDCWSDEEYGESLEWENCTIVSKDYEITLRIKD